MGLDSYLSAKVYVNRLDATNIVTDAGLDRYIADPSVDIYGTTVSATCAYWRKANQIHNWFVNRVQRGNDDCGSYYVSRDKLQDLLKACKEVKEDNSKAEQLLPTQSGFFYGGTQYDEWYFTDIDNTIKIIEECLEDENADEFEYSSSW